MGVKAQYDVQRLLGYSKVVGTHVVSHWLKPSNYVMCNLYVHTLLLVVVQMCRLKLFS